MARSSVTESGLMLLPLSMGIFLLGLASGRLASRLGSRNLVVAGSIVSAIGYFVVAFLHEAEMGHLPRDIFGRNRFRPGVLGDVEHGRRGDAFGASRCCEWHEREHSHDRCFAGSCLYGQRRHRRASPSGVPQESGYVNGFLMLGVVVGLGAVAALFIPALKRNKATHLEEANELWHPELAMVAGGTLAGDESE